MRRDHRWRRGFFPRILNWCKDNGRDDATITSILEILSHEDRQGPTREGVQSRQSWGSLFWEGGFFLQTEKFANFCRDFFLFYSLTLGTKNEDYPPGN